MRYRVIWDNDSACGTLGIYDTRQSAENAGNDWFWEMVSIDKNPKEAEEIYCFEIEEIEDEEAIDDSEDEHLIEGTISNFNRYIAGDR